MLLMAGLAAGDDAARPVDLSVWAAHATQENRTEKWVDADLEPIRAALNDLPFDTYKKIQVARQSIPCGQETRFVLDERYTLFVTPVSREKDGRIRLEIRVDLAPKSPEAKPVKALATRIVVTPGEKVKFRGLKREQGELIVVLSAAQ